MKTYSELFKDALFGVQTPPRYWQRYKDRLWLHHGIRPYPGLRRRVLDKLHSRQRKRGARILREMILAPSLFEKLGIPKDTQRSMVMVVPFKR